MAPPRCSTTMICGLVVQLFQFLDPYGIVQTNIIMHLYVISFLQVEKAATVQCNILMKKYQYATILSSLFTALQWTKLKYKFISKTEKHFIVNICYHHNTYSTDYQSQADRQGVLN